MQAADKAKHSAPARSELEEPEHKKVKKESASEDDGDSGMGFGFNNPLYSNHKIIIRRAAKSGEVVEEETVSVAKIVCSTYSQYFKKIIQENPEVHETLINLEEQYQIYHLKDLLRWMYVHEFQSQGTDLSSVMFLANTYQVEKALRQCAKELASDMTVENACGYLDQEVQMKAAKGGEQGFAGFEKLWKEAREYIRREFAELSLETLTSERFLNLTVEGIKAILESETVKIGTENTIFTTFRTWIHVNFEERKCYAAQLLPLVRFTQLRKDFLLDVVKKEGEMPYPEDAKKVFARKIIEAYMYHATSPERQEALKTSTERPREYDEQLLKETFFWKIDVANSKEQWSKAFFLGGYYLHLLMQRKNIANPNGGSIGLYLHIKADSCLGTDFYVPLAFELFVKNQVSGKYISPKGAYASPFTAQNKAWGYVDILGVSWEDFFKEGSQYNNKGHLEVKAVVWFKDYWEKMKSAV